MIFNQISPNKYDFSIKRMTKSTLCTYFANEMAKSTLPSLFRQPQWPNADCFANPNGQMLTILPTPMAKCTPSCHVDEFADRTGAMFTKKNLPHNMFQNEPLLRNSL